MNSSIDIYNNTKSNLPIRISFNKQSLHQLIGLQIDKILDKQESVAHDFYTLELTRSKPINLSKKDNSFFLTIDLLGMIAGKGLLKKANASGEITVDIKIDYNSVEGKYLMFDILINKYNWTIEPVISLGTKKISIGKIINSLLDIAIDKIQEKINNLTLSPLLPIDFIQEQLTELNHIELAINQSKLQVEIQQPNLYINDIEVDETKYTIVCKAEQLISIKESQDNYPLLLGENLLIHIDQSNTFKRERVSIPIKLTYGFIENIIKERFRSSPLEIMGKEIIILDTKIKYYKKNTLAININTNQKILHSFDLIVSTSLDVEKQEILLDIKKIDLLESNFIGKSLMIMDSLIKTSITKKISPLRLNEAMSQIKNSITGKLHELAIEKNIDIVIDQDKIELHRFEIAEDNIVIIISSEAKLEVGIK